MTVKDYLPQDCVDRLMRSLFLETNGAIMERVSEWLSSDIDMNMLGCDMDCGIEGAKWLTGPEGMSALDCCGSNKADELSYDFAEEEKDEYWSG